jgi:hypothetical protein
MWFLVPWFFCLTVIVLDSSKVMHLDRGSVASHDLEKKAEQGNAVDEEYEFTAFTVKNTNVSTNTNLCRILFIYRVVINFITYFFL